jgi:hypothetical protein
MAEFEDIPAPDLDVSEEEENTCTCGCDPCTGGCATDCNVPVMQYSNSRTGYCPDWARCLTSKVAGDLVLRFRGCIHVLRAYCSGIVWYDSATGKVAVRSSYPLRQPTGECPIERGKLPIAREMPAEGQCPGYVEHGWQQVNRVSQGELAVIDQDCSDEMRIDALAPDDLGTLEEGYGVLAYKSLETECGRTVGMWRRIRCLFDFSDTSAEITHLGGGSIDSGGDCVYDSITGAEGVCSDVIWDGEKFDATHLRGVEREGLSFNTYYEGSCCGSTSVMAVITQDASLGGEIKIIQADSAGGANAREVAALTLTAFSDGDDVPITATIARCKFWQVETTGSMTEVSHSAVDN